METTERFEKAVTKLYKAFHEGALNAYNCHACAVGNMCDGYAKWGVNSRNRIGQITDIRCKELSKYELSELGRVEKIFMSYFPESHLSDNKELQFKGLCAVVEYLCELDGIQNVMDYSSLFEYDEQGAKKELQTVFP